VIDRLLVVKARGRRGPPRSRSAAATHGYLPWFPTSSPLRRPVRRGASSPTTRWLSLRPLTCVIATALWPRGRSSARATEIRNTNAISESSARSHHICRVAQRVRASPPCNALVSAPASVRTGASNALPRLCPQAVPRMTGVLTSAIPGRESTLSAEKLSA
jgi:hypothetical protein